MSFSENPLKENWLKIRGVAQKERKKRKKGGDSYSEGDGGDPTPIVPEESPYEGGFPWGF